MTAHSLVQVRCPRCDKLLARVSPGAYLETKWPRCGEMFGQTVAGRGSDAIA
jgi:phage FluMu protein Com